MIRTPVLFLFLMAASALSAQRPGFIPPNETYLWPTNASDLMSATFAETRSAHFHAAIDVKTWGRNGFDVFATRDGIIWRASITPGGYGKMLIMQHSDGSFSLYAHLDDFEPRLQQYFDSIRYDKNIGDLDTVIAHRNLRYRKGDLIAYSGSTGIGPPHLHFELRSPLNRPFNPMLAGIRVPDRVPPQFTQLGIESLSPGGQIEGRPDFHTKKGVRKQGLLDFGTIKASGDIGLSAVAFDQANGAANTYAVYELEVQLDEKRIFHAKADSFGFEQTGQMFLDRVYPLLRNRGLFLQRLWIRDGNSVPFYDRSLGNGRIPDDGQVHTVTLIARDFEGNESRARLKVDFSKVLKELALRPKTPLKDRATNSLLEKSLLLNTSDWSQFIWPDGTRFHSFEMHLAGNRQQLRNEVLFHGRTSDFVATSGGKKAFFFRILPGSASEVQLPDQSLRVRFASHSVYDTLLVGLETFLFDGHPAFYLHPENEPTAGRIQVELVLPENTKNASSYRLYHLSPRWESYRARESSVQGKLLSGIIQDFGLHVALPDTIAPLVSAPSMIKNLRGEWLLSLSIRDNLSGIDARKTWVELDGKTGITEYESDKARLIFKTPGLRPKPGREVFVIAQDKAGNSKRYTFRTR